MVSKCGCFPGEFVKTGASFRESKIRNLANHTNEAKSWSRLGFDFSGDYLKLKKPSKDCVATRSMSSVFQQFYRPGTGRHLRRVYLRVMTSLRDYKLGLVINPA